MYTRIKEVRLKEGLSQQKFADKLGIARGNIAAYEVNKNSPSDAVISLISREFNVNENWLRTGEGEMKMILTKNQEIADFTDKLFLEVDESFKKRLIIALSKLNEKEWEVIEKISDELNTIK